MGLKIPHKSQQDKCDNYKIIFATNFTKDFIVKKKMYPNICRKYQDLRKHEIYCERFIYARKFMKLQKKKKHYQKVCSI